VAVDILGNWQQVLGLVVVVAIVMIPFSEIVRRAGFHRRWVFIWFVPIVGIIALWSFAFRDWPNIPRKSG
jgi:hypothetical protein